MSEDTILHVEIEDWGGTMEAFIVQQSPDPNGTELLQLTFNSMPNIKFQLHWRDGTTIDELNVLKHDPAFHDRIQTAVIKALSVFMANDFVAL